MFHLFIFHSVLNAQKYVYPNLDKPLIMLLKNSQVDANADNEINIDNILFEWALVEPCIKSIKRPNFNPQYFVENINILMSNLSFWEENNYMAELGETANLILWEFVHMRDCLDIKDYPLDKLLTAKLYFDEIQYVVHDEMMGLLYWFEFQDVIEDFMQKWSEYDCVDNVTISNYFHSIDPVVHNELKERVNDCMFNFIQSLDSGNRLDFGIPCDEMGEAMQRLIWSYSDPVKTMDHMN